MSERVHRLLGLFAAPLLILLAATGIVLAVDAALEASATPPIGRTSVAELIGRLAPRGRLESLAVTPSGVVVARLEGARRPVEVDPATGDLRPLRTPGGTVRLATDLHRNLALGDLGRLPSAATSLAALLVVVTGARAFARRRPSGGRLDRLHRRTGLLVALPLSFSAATGLVLAVAALDPLAFDGLRPPPGIARAEGSRRPATEIDTLRRLPLADLEELIAPSEDDPEDTWRLTTLDRFADIDPVDGSIVAVRERPTTHRAKAALLRLHAGLGRPLLAGGLGLAALLAAVAVLGGLAIVRGRRRSGRRRVGRRDPDADTVILVGSERGTTRGFAERLAELLRDHGRRVELCEMNDFAPHHGRAGHLLILTATWGAGVAPNSADRFLARLPHLERIPAFAVLGFGDGTSGRFCAFAEEVERALLARGGSPFLPLGRVDRGSETDYARWVSGLLAAVAPTPPPAIADVARSDTARPTSSPSSRAILSGSAMASRWTATIHLPAEVDASALRTRLAARVGEIEAALSRFRPDSEVVRFDAAAIGEPFAIGRDLAEVLTVGLEVGRLSAGAFDVGLAAETAAAGFGVGWAATGGRPRAIRPPAHELLDLDPVDRRLVKRGAISLDLGGIAKGWAVDEVARLLRERGLVTHLVGLDGEMRAGAARPDGHPWRIGVEAPVPGRRDLLGSLDLVDRAVATSGDYRRRAATTGRSHTLDPATGRPVVDGPASVTALADDCITAEAWATALMVSGRRGLATATAAGVDAIFADRRPTSPEES